MSSELPIPDRPWLDRISPPGQRLYIRAHPVVFWLLWGVLVVGVCGVVAPDVLVVSPATQVLPDWLASCFYAVYGLGAGMSLYGQIRCSAKSEAAGMSLLATSFTVQYMATVYFLHHYWVTGLFILSLAIGCMQRSRFLAQFGYPTRKVGPGRDDLGD